LTKRLLVTVALIALFSIIAVVPLPGVDLGALEAIARSDRVRVMALGFGPWAAAYSIIELWSFAFQKGIRLRRSGTAGRRTLTRFSQRVGIVLAILQAGGIATALQRSSSSVVLAPGILFTLVTALTLVAGSVLAFLMAYALSRWGIGNGFCLLITSPVVLRAVVQARQVPPVFFDEIFMIGTEILIWMIGIGFLAKTFLKRPEVAFSDDRMGELSVRLPAFPQGVEPALWTFSLVNFAFSLDLVLREDSSTPADQFQTPIVWLGVAVFTAAFSFGAFYLFSSRKRLDSNLPLGAMPSAHNVPVSPWLLPTTALLVVFSTLFYAGRSFGLRFTGILGFPGLVLLVALLFDLAGEIRFRMKHGEKVESVMEMDNVHGACYIHAALARHGIDSVIRAFHYRSLLFFFGPITKMEVLVPSAGVEEAQRIIRTIGLEIV
jgi:hypothetical protein